MFLIKTEKDRYIYFFEQRYLETIKEDKFSILDKIKDINMKEKAQFTLSIAVSNEGIFHFFDCCSQMAKIRCQNRWG